MQCAVKCKLSELDEHIANKCVVTIQRNKFLTSYEINSRLEHCPACDEEMPKRDIDRHMRKECEFRRLECRNPGCGMRVVACRLEAHEKLYCESQNHVRNLKLIEKGRVNDPKKGGGEKYPRDWAKNALIRVPKPGAADSDDDTEEESDDEEEEPAAAAGGESADVAGGQGEGEGGGEGEGESGSGAAEVGAAAAAEPGP